MGHYTKGLMPGHLEEKEAHLSQEKRRQQHFINLIPSENFTSQAVLDALGSVMQSKHEALTEFLSWAEQKLQINTPKDIPGRDITVVTSISMRQSVYAKKEL
jgi:serine hydroxymethyltransferase